MRAIWSFWTRPYRAGAGSAWPSDRAHLMAWVLSVHTARQFFPDTALVTDTEGARLLVDDLRLPLDDVSLALDRLEGHDPDWWMMGKLEAYRLQTAPFVHLDSDVFLWKPLPTRLLSAAVFAQNPEEAGPHTWYEADLVERWLRRPGAVRVPEAWRAYRLRGAERTAACCGVLGGNDVDFIRRYAETALRMLEANRAPLDTLPDKRKHNPLFEQYLLSACAAYEKVEIEYLFDSWASAADPAAAADAGYTHLISTAKTDPRLAERLAARVERDYPEVFDRCMAHAGPVAAPRSASAVPVSRD